MKKISFFFFLASLMLFMMFLMIGPRIRDDQQRTYCVHNIYLSDLCGFSLNCDSPDFIMLANNPNKLLERKNVRQERPGFIFLAYFLKSALYKLYHFGGSVTTLKIGDSNFNISVENIYNYFVYIILNIIFIIFSFWFLLKITFYEKNKIVPIFLLGMLLIYNDVVKAFVWSPHSQMLNIFVPLFCLWCFTEVVKNSLFRRPAIFIISFLAGLGVTIYASFFLYFPSIVIPALIMQQTWQPATTARLFVRISIIFLLTVLPSWLWYYYVQSTTGSFYSHSTEAYHHVVWMKETYQRGGLPILLSQLSNNLLNLSVFAAQQGWIFLLVLLPFIAGRSDSGIKWREMLLSPIFFGSIFVSAMFLVFFAMVGLIVPRVAYSAVPTLIVLTCHIIQHIEQSSGSLAQRLVPFTIFFYGIYELVKDGPYS